MTGEQFEVQPVSISTICPAFTVVVFVGLPAQEIVIVEETVPPLKAVILATLLGIKILKEALFIPWPLKVTFLVESWP